MLYAIIGAVIGAVGGYVLKHIQDTPIINELSEALIDEAKANDRLQKENRRLHSFATKKMVETAEQYDVNAIFCDLTTTVPDEPIIDFGGIEV